MSTPAHRTLFSRTLAVLGTLAIVAAMTCPASAAGRWQRIRAKIGTAVLAGASVGLIAGSAIALGQNEAQRSVAKKDLANVHRVSQLAAQRATDLQKLRTSMKNQVTLENQASPKHATAAAENQASPNTKAAAENQASPKHASAAARAGVVKQR
jgi:hypothetical protein